MIKRFTVPVVDRSKELIELDKLVDAKVREEIEQLRIKEKRAQRYGGL
jgi:hypothetical protein